MLVALEILTVLVVAVAMALALAHALELPGKLRLTKAQYLAMQPIYHLGFTIGGVAEPLGLLLTLALMFFLPWGSVPFWLAAAAFLALVAMHSCYWLPTHNFWLKDFKLKRRGARLLRIRSDAPPSVDKQPGLAGFARSVGIFACRAGRLRPYRARAAGDRCRRVRTLLGGLTTRGFATRGFRGRFEAR
ncbi:MAG: hypothetical protein ABWZ01_04790 [Methyloceanibacter sp.]